MNYPASEIPSRTGVNGIFIFILLIFKGINRAYLCSMTTPSFLDQVATRLIQEPHSWSRTAVIMPSRRAAVFMQQALARQIAEPALAPRFFTGEEFVLHTTGLQLEQPAVLHFLLYQAYGQEAKSEESFEEFIRWSSPLLEDINEIDRYLIAADKLFAYLADTKRLEGWDLQPQPTQYVQQYLAMWEMLGPLYERFRDLLLDTGRVYQGLAYRRFWEKMDTHVEKLSAAYDQLYFVGFNALNGAEEKIFTELHKAGLATFYWDVDAYYFEDERQEAGTFLRRSRLVQRLRDRGQFYGKHRHLLEDPVDIRLHGVSGPHRLAQEANQILGKRPPGRSWEDTALVLADESLLPLILENLHPDIPALNVTMGLPLKDTELAGFFQLIWAFPEHYQRQPQENERGERRYHREHWSALLSHPAFRRWQQRDSTEPWLRILENAKGRFWSVAEIQELGIPVHFFREIWDHDKDVVAYSAHLALLAHSMRETYPQREMAALHRFYQIFNQLHTLFQTYPYVTTIATAQLFYQELLRQSSLDLLGEPLEGLQLMGMLETRTLDFPHIILTSMNEGVLPRGRSQNSLIPYSIKREYGMPTYQDKDAVYAYHFYRLLQRAEQVDLLFVDQPGLGEAGEESRFIRQLEIELSRRNPRAKVQRCSPPEGRLKLEPSVTYLPKTPGMLERLEQWAAGSISPSALKSYLEYPEQFYHRYVLKIEDPEIDEGIDPRVEGNILHKALQALLDPYLQKGTVPRPEDSVFHKSIPGLREFLTPILQQESSLSDQETQGGKGLLALHTMAITMQRFLEAERNRCRKNPGPTEILLLEEALEANISSPNRTIRLKGNADRLEKHADHIRVIDYKTGQDSQSDYNLVELELEQLRLKPKSLQLLIYAVLSYRWQAGDSPVQSFVYSLRSPGQEIQLKVDREPFLLTAHNVQEVEELIGKLIEEILNPDLPLPLEKDGLPEDLQE